MVRPRAPGTQVPTDPLQRHVDDRRVEHDDEEAEQCREEGAAPPVSVHERLLAPPNPSTGCWRPAGAALTQALFDRTWIARIERTRAVKVTAAGREALAQAGLAEVLTHLDETASNDAAR